MSDTKVLIFVSDTKMLIFVCLILRCTSAPVQGILARQDLAEALKTSILNTITLSATTTGAIGTTYYYWYML